VITGTMQDLRGRGGGNGVQRGWMGGQMGRSTQHHEDDLRWADGVNLDIPWDD